MLRPKSTSFAVAAAVALAAVACDGGDGASDSRPNKDEPAITGPAGSLEPSWVTRFLGPRTDEQAVRNLFEVEADHAEYWRMYVLDRFDGETWTSTDPGESEAGPLVPVPGHLGQLEATAPPVAQSLDQTFKFLGDIPGQGALPMAQTPRAISEGSFDEVTWDAARGQAFVDGDLEAGMEYSVRSQIVVPTADELDPLQFDASTAYGPWTQLPTDLDPRITEIAQEWTAGEASDYRKVLAIQQHFQDGEFTYSTDVEPIEGEDALVEFLTTSKVGFCQHYTSAMAVLVRALGLPARVAVGFRSGTRQEDGSFLVQAKDAHVWVEVLFPSYGWLPFEPEAGTAHPNAQPGTYLNPVAPAGAS